MRIGIRVDASLQSGLGHVKRCLSLAHALRGLGGDVVFVTRDHGIDTRGLIEQEGFPVATLQPPADALENPPAYWAGSSWDTDAAETCAALGGAAIIDWIVVDHYGLDRSWHAIVSNALSCRICAIDDLADRPIAADVLVDHNPARDHRAKYSGHLATETRILGGPRFALLGPSYVDVACHVVFATVRSIGIFMGGTDPINASALAVAACRDGAGFDGPIEVASTSANPHLAELYKLRERTPGLSLLLDQPELSAFFARHDLQIGAGGGASWERCRLGAPTIAVVCADNQTEVVNELVSHGAARTPVTLTVSALGRTVAELLNDTDSRRQLAERARSLVDGRGAERVAMVLLNSTLTLRPANVEDAHRAYGWRNDPASRQYAWDTTEIPMARHLAWWQATLSNPRRRLLIGQIDNRAVGVLRFDIEGDTALLSIYLDPTLHGLGLGAAMLCNAQRYVIDHEPGIDCLSGEIQPANRSSTGAFAAANFKPAADVLWVWRRHRPTS